MSSRGVPDKVALRWRECVAFLTNVSPFDGTVSQIAIDLTRVIRAESNARTPGNWSGESLYQSTDNDVLTSRVPRAA